MTEPLIQPYTYLIGWTGLNKWYYGRRTRRGCTPSELCVTYFTSSVIVHQYIKEYGLPDVICVRKVFNTVVDCIKHEVTVLTRLNAAKSNKWLNQHNGGNKFSTTGKRFPGTNKGCVIVKDADNNIFQTTVTDLRFISGELVGINKGRVPVKDCEGNVFQTTTDNIKYLNGTYQHVAKGHVVTRDVDGKIHYVKTTDPRYISGELVHNTRNTVVVKNEQGETYQTSIDDPDYISKKVVGANSGKVKVVDNNGKVFQVDKDHPKLISGELLTESKWRAINDINTRRYLYMVIQDPDGNIFTLQWNEYYQFLKTNLRIGTTWFIRLGKKKGYKLIHAEINPNYHNRSNNK
jgi:hypothetical protein